MKDAQVKQRILADIQRRLKDRGYYTGKLDGIFGPNTLWALNTYRTQRGLPSTLPVTAEDAVSLGVDLQSYNDLSNRLADESFKKNVIMRVQLTLQALGYYDGPTMGVMDPATRAALNSYRKAKGIKTSETLDVTTLNALGIVINE